MAAICMTPQDATSYIWWAWLVSWFAAALWSDHTIRRPSLRRQAAYRLTTICGALLLFGWLGIRRYDIRFWRLDGSLGWLFVATAAAGVLFMWWARLHLGRLWSGSVTRKADHHIVEVHRPFIGAKMFDGLPAQFGRQNPADSLGFRLFQ